MGDHNGLRTMKKAFTLIELLVVIAIIAILAAILFPVFAQAKAAAKKTSCVSNLKQMATATFLYTNDADGSFPQNSYSTNQANGTELPGGIIFTVFDALMPYTKNKDIYICAEDAKAVNFNAYLNHYGMTSYGGLGFVSYIPNGSLFTSPVLAAYDYGLNISVVNESSVPTPVATTMFYDGTNLPGGQANPDFARLALPRPDADPDANSVYRVTSAYYAVSQFPGKARHLGSLNVCFGDGHARSVKETGVLVGTSPDLYFGGGSSVKTYNLPYDLNGIPDVVSDPKP